jgi:precorrin-6Y C5,15-methyltransferase (decarboxylating)
LHLVKSAQVLVGGARHLALVPDTAAERLPWPSPLTDGVEQVLAHQGRRVCVLASGDPFFFGVGVTLMRHVKPEEVLCVPAPSAFSLAASRLCWDLQGCTTLSLHGRPLSRIIPHLQPGARILALSWDGETPGRVASLLRERGMSQSRITVCEALGGPRERLVGATASTLQPGPFDPLNTLAIEVVAGPGARVLPLAPGLPDALFENDGQITKREIRAMTLAALAPLQGQRLWDIGAGSGSVGIEWMLRHPANRAIAIEPRPDRAARIARNALSLGVPDLAIVEGSAPAALPDLARPDAVFVGGGGTDPAVLDAAWAALPEGGRLVVNAVTLETQGDLMRRYQSLGGDLMSVQVARADPVGPFHGWRPAMPVVQWSVVKPWADAREIGGDAR